MILRLVFAALALSVISVAYLALGILVGRFCGIGRRGIR